MVVSDDRRKGVVLLQLPIWEDKKMLLQRQYALTYLLSSWLCCVVFHTYCSKRQKAQFITLTQRDTSSDC